MMGNTTLTPCQSKNAHSSCQEGLPQAQLYATRADAPSEAGAARQSGPAPDVCNKTEDHVVHSDRPTLLTSFSRSMRTSSDLSNTSTSECCKTPSGRGRKTVALVADYDGCWDIISPSNLPGAKMDQMFEHAKQIDRLLYPRQHAQQMLMDFVAKVTGDADEVILCCGSNRQSRKLDDSNSRLNDNGLALVGLKQLAEMHNWQFSPILLEDAGIDPADIMNAVNGSSEIKRKLNENHFEHFSGPTEVYFFDDIEKYLKYTRENAKIPKHIHLKTVQFDWYGICMEGSQDGEAPLRPIPADTSDHRSSFLLENV